MFLAQINQESGFNPAARSGAGAVGIAQIVPKYHPGVNAHDPVAALNWAASYMAGLVHKYGSYQQALSVYNSGRPDAYLDPRFASGQTYNYVRSILAAAGHTAPAPRPVGAPPVAPQVPVSPLVNPAVQQVLASNDRLLGVAPPNFAALAAAQAQPRPVAAQPPPPTAVPAVGSVRIGGNVQGVQPAFLAALERAVRAAGGDEIKVTSGYRTPAHNAAVNGVPHSLHTRGLALDGYARIQGRWVPLGAALKAVAPQFGLRSGDTPGFFRGSLDPVHVDFGYGHQ